MDLLVHGMLSNAAAVAVLAVLVAIAGRVCRRPALIHSLCLLAMLKLVTPPVVSLPVPMPAAAALPAPVSPDDPALDATDAGPAEVVPISEDLDDGLAAEPPPRDAFPRTWEGEPPGEPGRIPARTEPRPPGITQSDPETIEASTRQASWPWSWESTALGFVLGGAMAWWALAAVRIVRFHRLIRDVEPMPAEWQDEIGELAARLGLRRPPTACLVPGDVPPMLWAIGPRARLLVPARLWANLGDDERTSLILHELAHLRRRDHWVRWGELAVAGLYWWHPAVWWIRRALREAEEQCCDAWVVWAMPRGARTYAAALVAAIEFVSGVRTVPAAAASATLGNGHVSSLKRRLRMIVKARTPKGLSWAGRLAVAGLSALLLPLAPSWGQKDTAAVEPPGEQTARHRASSLEENPRGELDKLNQQIDRTRKERNGNAGSVAIRAEMLDQDLAYLTRLRDAVRQKIDQTNFEAKRAKDDDNNAKPKQAKTREATERIEKELKALKEKLGKDLSPVGDEVRKSLERALDEIQQSLKKEGMTAEDLRRAVEKSRNELGESLKRGGPVEKEMRLAAERARKDMQEAMERSMKETERVREAFGARMREAREQQKKAAEEHRQAMQERQERMRREAERMRDLARARQDERKAARGKSERPKAEAAEPEKTERGEDGREDLDAARREIRELQARLREANRRLEQLQRRESRRPEPPARDARPEAPRAAEPPARPARPEAPRAAEPPARPATPAKPARPAEPRRPATSARPVEPRRAAPPARDDYERRFRELDDKMDRLLRELQEIKGRSTTGARAILAG